MSCRPLRPFWSYYGSAWGKTRRGAYPRPVFDTIVEPFAGAAGYSCHHPDRNVVLCDLDPTIAGLWRYLIRVSASEVLALPDVPPDGDVASLAVCEEARWLIGWWCGRARPRVATSATSWVERYGKASTALFWGHAARERIAEQVEAIRHWRVFECDYRDAPVSGEATWFVDPPYSSKAGAAYQCSNAGIDFDDLGRWCWERSGQVIACEADGASWLPFSPCGSHRATRGASVEVSCVIEAGRVVPPAQVALFETRLQGDGHDRRSEG